MIKDMFRVAASAAAAWLPAAACAVVAITSNPDGASVSVDGRPRGITPLRLFDLKPGVEHHARVSAKDFEDEDVFFKDDKDSVVAHHVELTPAKGLLLVTSEPEGAEILLDGYSLGSTPRLVTTLDAGRHYALVLKKQGWLDAKLEVKFDGRRPVASHVKMIVDSGVVDVGSEPLGAEVAINGRVRGETPLSGERVPKGRITIVLKTKGYKTLSKEVRVDPGAGQEFFFKLGPEPGSLSLVSIPEGARFYVDGKPQGKGPVDMTGLEEKEYLVRAELDGYAPEEKKVFVNRGAAVKVEFEMSVIIGGLELRTIPAGAHVIVDGHPLGVTEGRREPGVQSDLFQRPEIREGSHTLVVRLDGYKEYVKHFEVKPGEMTRINVVLRKDFRPDIRLATAASKIEGELVSSEGPNYIVRTSPGVERTVPKNIVISIESIGADGDGKGK